MTAVSYPHLDTEADGKAVIRGTGTKVIMVAMDRLAYHWDADEIQRLYESAQPVLVGTTSIEKSERLSELLKKKGIKHVVLNAKFHEREAEIVAQAGRKGAVTIATNMAGRGTDILLGGNPEFMAKHKAKWKRLWMTPR